MITGIIISAILEWSFLANISDAAQFVLSKCIKTVKGHFVQHDKNLEMEFDFELIDDIYIDWGVGEEKEENIGGNKSTSKAGNKLTPKVIELLEEKDTHPLYLMVWFCSI